MEFQHDSFAGLARDSAMKFCSEALQEVLKINLKYGNPTQKGKSPKNLYGKQRPIDVDWI